MGDPILQKLSAELWALVRRQHGVIARWQLLEHGLRRKAIKHRVARGRLHQVYRGVYAVGRPELTQLGRFMAAVLACGPDAALSHDSAGALWGFRPAKMAFIEVSVPAHVTRRSKGIIVHRRSNLTGGDVSVHRGIPVTTPVCTIIDLAHRLERDLVEQTINEADKRGLTTPEELRRAADAVPHRRGAPALRSIIDRRTFTATDSVLERMFLRIVRDAGLPQPQTQVWLKGFRVDFYWPELKLVVETDGATFHRTPERQEADARRSQALFAAGFTPLRFTHAQVKYAPGYVRETLEAAVRRLTAA